jgi:hypothetical protein
MLFHRAALPLSRTTLNYAAGIIRRHRKSIGSRWRKLNPGQQALLVLAYLAEGRDVRRAGGRVRGGNHDGLAVRGGGRPAAGGPGAEAPPGGPGREEGRTLLLHFAAAPRSKRPIP